jgi:hypothetical protein
MKDDKLSQEELNKLDGLSRIIRYLKRIADGCDNKKGYTGMKDFFNETIITCQEFQLNDMRRGLTGIPLQCPTCRKKTFAYTEDDIKKIQDGVDPATLRDEEFKRAVPKLKEDTI